MDRENARLRAIFDEAIQAPPEERARLLAARCGDDAALRRRVEALLATAESDEPFLAQPTRHNQDTRSSTPLSERPGTRIGPYKLLQQIGEGGFGVVFMAQQDQPVRRRVALKVIKPGMDTRQVVARFEAERQALALMDHPNIAKVLDAGATESGRPYFVMEYVVGDPVTEFADAHRLSVRDRLDVFLQVCQAVQHAHQKGIIHRDLKPRNVIVSIVDGKPFAKVIDFGIAKATGSALTDKTLFTEHRQLIGTPEYMSPEQAEGSPDIDTRTDVYALGVLLYELLAGTTPFDAKRLRSAAFAEMQRIIREEDPPLPSVRLSRDLAASAATAAARQAEPGKLGTQIKGELDWIVMKALEKDRGRRYESASQLLFDVQRHLHGEAVSAAPPSLQYRFNKLVRRHRKAALIIGALGLALTLGVGGIAWGLKRATDANEELRETLRFTRQHVGALCKQQRQFLSGSSGVWKQDTAHGVVGFRWSGMSAKAAMTDDIEFSPLQDHGDDDLTRGLVYHLFINAHDRYVQLEDANLRLQEEVRKVRLAEAATALAIAFAGASIEPTDQQMAAACRALATRVELLGNTHPDVAEAAVTVWSYCPPRLLEYSTFAAIAEPLRVSTRKWSDKDYRLVLATADLAAHAAEFKGAVEWYRLLGNRLLLQKPVCLDGKWSFVAYCILTKHSDPGAPWRETKQSVPLDFFSSWGYPDDLAWASDAFAQALCDLDDQAVRRLFVESKGRYMWFSFGSPSADRLVADTMADFRAGRFSEVVDAMQEAKRLYESNGMTASPTCLSLLAMSHFQLGRQDAARAVLAELKRSMDSVAGAVLWTKDDYAIRAEAETLIDGRAASQPTP